MDSQVEVFWRDSEPEGDLEWTQLVAVVLWGDVKVYVCVKETIIVSCIKSLCTQPTCIRSKSNGRRHSRVEERRGATAQTRTRSGGGLQTHGLRLGMDFDPRTTVPG